MVSTVRAAVRGRQRQYELRDTRVLARLLGHDQIEALLWEVDDDWGVD